VSVKRSQPLVSIKRSQPLVSVKRSQPLVRLFLVYYNFDLIYKKYKIIKCLDY